MATTFRPVSESHRRFAAQRDAQYRLVILLVTACNGLAQNDLSLAEFHGVEVGPPLFAPMTVARLVIATGDNGRGIFLDAAARERAQAPGLFRTEDARGLALVQLPNLIIIDRPPAVTICEVLTRLGALALSELVIPHSSIDPGIASAARQAESALRAGQSPVLLAPDEAVTDAVLSHLSDAASCLIQKRSLIELFHPSGHETPSARNRWFAPFTALTDADFLLATDGQPARYTQRRLARGLLREPQILIACVTRDTACAVQDPLLARKLVWIPVEPTSGA